MFDIFGRVGSFLDGRNASTATIQSLIVRFGIIAINVGTGILTARALGPQGRGELSAMALWPQFLAYTLTLGIPQSLLYNLKKYPDQKSNLFSLSIIFSVILGSVSSLIGIMFMPKWLSQYSIEIIETAQLLMWFSPLILLGFLTIAAFEAQEEFTYANQRRYLAPLTTMALLLLLTVFGWANPTTFAFAYLGPNLPINLWMLNRLLTQFKFQVGNLKLTSKRLLDYGVKAYGIDLFGSLSSKLGQGLIIGMLSPTATGLFAVAVSMSKLLDTFAASIDSILVSKATARPISEIVPLVGRSTRIITFTTFVCLLPLFALGPYLLRALYGEEFIDAAFVFRLLLLESLLNCTTGLLSKAFMAIGKPGIVTVLQAIGMSSIIPLMLILIPRYGLGGAGFSFLIASCVRLAAILMCYPIVLKVNPPNLIVTLDDIQYARKNLMRSRA